MAYEFIGSELKNDLEIIKLAVSSSGQAL